METHEDMTVAEYAIRLWELSDSVESFIINELDLVRGIPAHVAHQSIFCTCLYCEFLMPGELFSESKMARSCKLGSM